MSGRPPIRTVTHRTITLKGSLMHVIITAIGSAGDVHPFIGIGRTLAARGHRITFCASAVFAPVIERCGFKFLPLGTREEYQAVMADPALWHPRTSLPTLWKTVGGTLREQYRLLEQACDDDTILLGSLWAFSARLLQERHGIPLVTGQVTPFAIWSPLARPVHPPGTNLPAFVPYPLRRLLLGVIEHTFLDRLMKPELNGFRRELGLPAVKRIISQWISSPDRVLGLFPDWFAPIQQDWPAQTVLTGFPLFDESGFEAPDAELEDFLNASPPVVFTPGSTTVNAEQYFAAAAKALKLIDRRGVFLTRQPVDPSLSSDGRILVRPYVPMSRILPHTSALVHHGGVGTTALAIAAGVPQITTPFAHDHFDNAARMQRLGCGLQVSTPASAEALASALDTVLNSADVRASCERYSKAMASGDSAREAAALQIEAIARRAATYRVA
ncbi:rhamnosyltransferase subunit B [Pseudomonas sp. NFACC15-1]|nr:rhamnosyltransferase subunit B [Pseudomonas sp. NFACC15-1]SDB67324.1 rhamnosyltransferase subunit B [Pseudomonas sp. NFACC13-1]SDZ03812.1 rhamnosyltransferase subunit B [Pseudomonas sp. NFACC14]